MDQEDPSSAKGAGTGLCRGFADHLSEGNRCCRVVVNLHTERWSRVHSQPDLRLCVLHHIGDQLAREQHRVANIDSPLRLLSDDQSRSANTGVVGGERVRNHGSATVGGLCRATTSYPLPSASNGGDRHLTIHCPSAPGSPTSLARRCTERRAVRRHCGGLGCTRRLAGVDECLGNVSEFDVQVLGGAAQDVERLIRGDAFAFDEDALCLSDEFSGAEGCVEVEHVVGVGGPLFRGVEREPGERGEQPGLGTVGDAERVGVPGVEVERAESDPE